MGKRSIPLLVQSDALVLAILCFVPLAQATAAEEPSCSDSEVTFRVTDGAPVQGDLLVAELRSQLQLGGVTGRFGKTRLRFWHTDDLRVHQALVAVDFRRRAGSYRLESQARTEKGRHVSCQATLKVQDANFPVQKLTLNKRFVDLSAEDLARSRRERTKLGRVFSKVTRERLWSGPFQLPLEGVKASGSFGKRRILNGKPRSPHSGEDYSAPTGTPIRCTHQGRVALAEDLFFTGKTVIIDHGLGLFSLYAHLDEMSVQEGEAVNAGQLLGKVGATGRVTGPHLHWMVRLGRSRVDPEALLKLPFPANRTN